ncbi:MAG: HYR domain-containing protein [Bacteroidetes bacterium]|nr:HYR domain-containing protein [Bacteroidota bacterium]
MRRLLVKTAGAFAPGGCPRRSTLTHGRYQTAAMPCCCFYPGHYSSDTTAPVVTDCPVDITVNNTPATCGATVTWTAPSFTDNCSSPVIVSSHNTGDTFPTGTTSVTYTATDNCGNSVSCTFNVIVTDTESPVISCPSNITQSALLGQTSASVVIPDPVVSDNCSVSILTWTLSGATTATSSASGSNLIGTYTFNEGITTVTYNSADAAGHTSSCYNTIFITTTTSSSSHFPVIWKYYIAN